MDPEKIDFNLYQRINTVMGEVKYVQKEKKAGMQYATVSHDDVTKALHDSLVSNGIIYYPSLIEATQDGNKTMVLINVRFVNIDKPDEFIDTVSIGHGIDSQDKGPGKAMSYAVKYALLKTFGLETGEDSDLDQNVTYTPPKAPQREEIKADIRKNLPPAHTAHINTEDEAFPFFEEEFEHRTSMDLPGAQTITVYELKKGISSKNNKPYEIVKTQEHGDLFNNSGKPMQTDAMYQAVINGTSITDWSL